MSNLTKMAENYPNGYKTQWEKEKLLITSKFSFSHSVFKRLVSQGRQKVSFYGNGLIFCWDVYRLYFYYSIRRGLIMGIWNSHTSVGNILGSVIASIWVNHAWGWSFVVPGIIIGSVGVLVFLFLVTGESARSLTTKVQTCPNGNEMIKFVHNRVNNMRKG